MTNSMPALVAAMAVAGFLFGRGYFAMLRQTVRLFVSRRSLLGPAVLTLGRIAAAAIFLMLAARLGAAPLLAAAVGFLLSRSYALRAAPREG